MRTLLIPFALMTAILLPGQKADAAAIIWVGECGRVASYATIQAAITAANAGDTINVCPGVYTESVAINKAGLTLVSTGGANVTRIAAPVPASPVVAITQPHATLIGFTLSPAGSTAKYDIGVNVAIEGDASADVADNIIRGGRIGVNLGCSSSGSTIYHNIVRGATETGINIDTCEIENLPLPALPGSTFNSVHHNTVCGGLFPYSIALGPGSDFNDVHHNLAKWIHVSGDGNIVHNNTAHLFDVTSGTPVNVTFNNTVAAVCP